MLACFYTLEDLKGEVGGYVELHSIAHQGRVFIDWNTFVTAWAVMQPRKKNGQT